MSQDDGAGNIVEAWDLASLDADGFTLKRTVGSVLDQGLFWLAVRGPQFARGLLTQPGTSGTQTISGLPFQPRALLFDGGGHDNVDAHALLSNCIFGFGTDPTHRVAFAQGNEAINGWNRSVRIDTSAIVIPGLNPTNCGQKAVADLKSINPDGFTLDWLYAVDSTARRYCYIAIGDAITGAADMTTTPNMPSGLAVVQSAYNVRNGISRRAGDRDFRSIATSTTDYGNSSNVGGSEGWDQPQVEMVTDTGASGSGGKRREIVTVADAPKSGPQVARFTLKAYTGAGYPTSSNAGFAEINNPGSASADRWGSKLYGAFWFRLSPNFHGDVAGYTKLLYVYAGGNEQFVPIAYGSSGMKTGRLTFTTFIQGTADPRDTQRLPTIGGVSYEIVRGVWYRAEFYAKMNSAAGVADGIFRSWITGTGDLAPTQIHEITNLQWSGTTGRTWSTIKSPDFEWGGSGGPLPEDIYIDYDHALWATE